MVQKTKALALKHTAVDGVFAELAQNLHILHAMQKMLGLHVQKQGENKLIGKVFFTEPKPPALSILGNGCFKGLQWLVRILLMKCQSVACCVQLVVELVEIERELFLHIVPELFAGFLRVLDAPPIRPLFSDRSRESQP